MLTNERLEEIRDTLNKVVSKLEESYPNPKIQDHLLRSGHLKKSNKEHARVYIGDQELKAEMGQAYPTAFERKEGSNKKPIYYFALIKIKPENSNFEVELNLYIGGEKEKREIIQPLEVLVLASAFARENNFHQIDYTLREPKMRSESKTTPYAFIRMNKKFVFRNLKDMEEGIYRSVRAYEIYGRMKKLPQPNLN